jgi:small subunit ribosomal protein S8
MAMHETVNIPHSKVKESLAGILREEGFISTFKVEEGDPFKSITLTLKYVDDRQPAIRKMQRISKPGRRVYVGRDQIPVVLGGLGVSVLSTSRGLMTGKRARTDGVGGEVLFEIY